MATRSRTSFQKRQKEIARMEKQRDKAAKRAQRKLAPTTGISDEPNELNESEDTPLDDLTAPIEQPSTSTHE